MTGGAPQAGWEKKEAPKEKWDNKKDVAVGGPVGRPAHQGGDNEKSGSENEAKKMKALEAKQQKDFAKRIAEEDAGNKVMGQSKFAQHHESERAGHKAAQLAEKHQQTRPQVAAVLPWEQKPQ